MIQAQLLGTLQSSQEYFERSSSALTEEHSKFAPADGMFTAAQVVAHVALTIDWFVEGAFDRADGFDMNFEAHDAAARSFTSLEKARAALATSYEAVKARISSLSDAELMAPIPDGPVMGGLPRMSIVSGIQDHTAHHRGALSVYARLVGTVPPMPYM
ncbi:DinB superfamily protein [Planctomycetes bacterium Poly30]|uniref:DinB superfamily protein n=1 Tax=Saltatorellus ferox TaxID=2528018 RepID=A0A518ELB8_9BACT|nr:DinB superfamily protein [Planctomycetes bacterium Poly30]